MILFYRSQVYRDLNVKVSGFPWVFVCIYNIYIGLKIDENTNVPKFCV